MLREPDEYNKEDFALGLMHSSLTINGATPLCMNDLREGSRKEITAEAGIWRLWDQPKDVARAKSLV